ncbi:hypothetical protein LTR72_000599 [Exophiala xenobiotica]|nr:hypothetical protein LTR72_000599 [Exophiala xenobiotica]KAK5299932.1 hypothetical protein LTR14_002147 [Exophiala xenobiotica]KAK5499225.1 hypothetical protein LTR55_000047 [Exophiala xenobiotica]
MATKVEMDHLEDQAPNREGKGATTDSQDASDSSTNGALKMRGDIVLMPQPSDDPNDPLNWSSFRKHMAMSTISYLAFVCYMAVTSLVPGTLQLAETFGTTKYIAVYLGNTPVALYAVGPFLWSPLSHFVGRRPVLLLANLISVVGTIVVASAPSYGACMVGRVIQGLGGSAFWTLGPASIGDIFFRHEKGKKVGTSTLAIVVSPFAGGIIGGAVINNKSLGWRWSQWISLIFIATGLVMQIVFLPETIYVRDLTRANHVDHSQPTLQPTFWARYGIRIPKRNPDKRHSFMYLFTRPFVMFTYPAVFLASFWFGITYMLHVGITAEIPLIFEAEPYNFSVLGVGLTAFSGLIGALIGEAYAGPAIDLIARRCLRQGKEWRPEMRFKAIWPALVSAPLGLLMFGVSIQFGSSWVTPLVGQGIYIFGVEIATTVIQTYLLESYPRQGAEASLVFNLARNLLSYTTPFFVPKMLAQINFSATFGIFAALIVFFFPLCIGTLIWRGKAIRERSGEPGWSRD